VLLLYQPPGNPDPVQGRCGSDGRGMETRPRRVLHRLATATPMRDTILRAGDEAVVLSTDPDAAGLTALFAAPARD